MYIKEENLFGLKFDDFNFKIITKLEIINAIIRAFNNGIIETKGLHLKQRIEERNADLKNQKIRIKCLFTRKHLDKCGKEHLQIELVLSDMKSSVVLVLNNNGWKAVTYQVYPTELNESLIERKKQCYYRERSKIRTGA